MVLPRLLPRGVAPELLCFLHRQLLIQHEHFVFLKHLLSLVMPTALAVPRHSGLPPAPYDCHVQGPPAPFHSGLGVCTFPASSFPLSDTARTTWTRTFVDFHVSPTPTGQLQAHGASPAHLLNSYLAWLSRKLPSLLPSVLTPPDVASLHGPLASHRLARQHWYL